MSSYNSRPKLIEWLRERKVKGLVVGLVWSSLLLLHDSLQAQSLLVSTFTKEMAGSTIYRLDDGKQTPVFQVRSKEVVHDEVIIPSPHGSYFGAIVSARDFAKDEKGIEFIAKRLIVCDRNGQVLSQIPEVQLFCWSPSGDSLCYVTGIEREGYGFKPKALYTLLLPGGQPKRLLDFGRRWCVDLSWTGYDGQIYIYEGNRVSRLNPLTGRLESTPFHGIFFSPDGAYYAEGSYEGSPARLYKKETNKEITPQAWKETGYINTLRWIDNQRMILGNITDDRVVTIDVKSGLVLSKIEGRVIGLNRSTGEVVVRSKAGAITRHGVPD